MESEPLNKDVIIVLTVLIPFTVFILILCGLHHRRKSKKAKLHSIHYEEGRDDVGKKHDNLSNVVSMRDRIREWKVAPTEMVELVDICKSRGVLDIPVDNIGKIKSTILLFLLFENEIWTRKYIEDITRRCKDVNFIFE